MTFVASKSRLLAAAVVALTIGSVVALPARAEDHDRGRGQDRDWHEHERYARHWHRVYPVTPPGVVYTPPPVVYAPPPPPPGINLILPLNFH